MVEVQWVQQDLHKGPQPRRHRSCQKGKKEISRMVIIRFLTVSGYSLP